MTDNLPARPSFGAAGIPLSEAPTAALAFALGYAVARPVDANAYAPFLAMCEELMARPAVVGDHAVGGGQWAVLMALLPPDVARRIEMLYQAQRGQRWARTGSRHGTTPTDTGNT